MTTFHAVEADRVEASSRDQVAQALVQWSTERPDLDVSPQAVIGRVQRLACRLGDELAAEYVHHGLDDDEFDVLETLRLAGEPYTTTRAELARRTSTATWEADRRLERLVDAGLAWVGEAHAGLTPAGRVVIDEAVTARVAQEHRLIGPLTADERTDLERLLTRWIDALEGPDVVGR